jgi:hypothetical protein
LTSSTRRFQRRASAVTRVLTAAQLAANIAKLQELLRLEAKCCLDTGQSSL